MDYAHKWTDKEIEALEERLAREYAKAEKEIQEKLDKFYERYKEKDEKWQEKVKNAPKGEKAKINREYQKWRTGQMVAGKRWEQMRDTIAQDIANVNQTARDIAMGKAPEVYAKNFNFGTYQIEHDARVDTFFTLYNRESVAALMRDNPKLLPDPGRLTKRRIQNGLDVRYNRQQLQSVAMQGIVQGESIPKIAKRLAEEVGEKNRKAAVRNARTMMTGAQNKGRIDSYKRAQELGIELEKEWMATHDGRTRHWHIELDEVSVPVDKPFVNEYGEIDYPGDSGADPANVYNCRCTLVSNIKRVKTFSERLKENQRAAGQTYEKWEKDHIARGLGANNFPSGNRTTVKEIGNIDFDDKDLMVKTLREYEEEIVGESMENAIILANNGKIYRLVGDETGVDIEGALGKGLLEQSYGTHNHPTGKGDHTFSESDIGTFMRNNMAVLRGIDDKYEYELNRNYEGDKKIMSLEKAALEDVNPVKHSEVQVLAERNKIGYKRERRNG